MNSNFLLLIVVFILTACNNQPVKQQAIMADTTKLQERKDSSGKKDATITPINYELTQAEMKDDSVFTDGSEPASWANAGFDHPIAFKKFFKRLQYWVAHDQKDSVATAIIFPLKHPPVKNTAAFLANYDTFINEKVKKALIAQNLRQIFRRDQGAMIGDGALWFMEAKKGFSIITINN